ncbi:facilitated trehalose transporter Tret1-like [Cephus cinctus]|uniref:Facilitated trehalose transporter Tret1-like n=1 Tax=Cephus cinctus TaxID=211228 RepID=A0AAJ7RFW8_CEPCN|nr:facilitated trehalose transporter Tret1-like [Cephus cinctus]
MRDDVNKNIKQATKTKFSGTYTLKVEKPTEVSILLFIRQTLAALGPMLSTVCIGITVGYSAILLAQLQKNTQFSEGSRANILIGTTNDESWLAASGALLMSPGCWLSGILMEFFGRRVTHLIISPIFCLAWVAIGLAPNRPTLIFGRLLCGLCVGLQAPLGPVYVAEISEPQLRGILLSAISLAVSIGILFVHVVGSFVSWENTALISMVFPILCFLICLNAPESPSWLLKKHKSTLARESWIYLRGLDSFEEFEKIGLAEQNNTRLQDVEPTCNYSKQNNSEAHGTSELTIVECGVGARTVQEEPNVKSIVESIQSITQEQSTSISNIHQNDHNSQKQKIKSVKRLFNIWTNAMFWKPLIILNIFFFVAQFSGVNVLSFYCVQLLKEVMTSTENSYLATILVDLVRVLASVLACWMTKKFSRRFLAITSATGASLSLLILSGVMFWNMATSWIPLFLLLIFVCAVSIGLVPLPWLLCGEIFPTPVRALGTGISSACAFIYFFAVVRLGPFMLKDLGSPCTFFIFGLITLIGTCLLYFFLPETKDKTLTDIGRYFQKKNDV